MDGDILTAPGFHDNTPGKVDAQAKPMGEKQNESYYGDRYTECEGKPTPTDKIDICCVRY